jgi:uncharacterized small protein (DUF1192 family)
MADHHRETDYFVPLLTPYAQWVSAYRDLIPALYQQHKTVRRTWKAFKEAIPGVEQRLEFDVFEQILLFSLFLSEWQKAFESTTVQKLSRTAPQTLDPPKDDYGPGRDAVIQELRTISDERDKALWNLKELDERVGELKAQNERLENLAKTFEMDSDRLQNELDISHENLLGVTHELDAQKSENASLHLEIASLCANRASLDDRIQKLMQKTSAPAFSVFQNSDPAPFDAEKDSPGGMQMVIQWAGQTGCARPESCLTQRPTPSKRIGRWSAQQSKDGYYRLYRKIRGRVYSIYVGRDLDINKAQKKIAQKEKELLGADSSVEP